MSEKRLSFIIDPSKAKTGAERIKDSLRSIQAVADKLQKTMNVVGGGDVATSSKGVSGLTQAYEKTAKAATDLEKAQQNLAKSLQFWQQRTKDLNSEQYQTLLRLRESARQIEAYQKSMVSALTPAQRVAKAEQELRKNIQSNITQLRLAQSANGKRNTALQATLSLQKQLNQSEIRLKQAFTAEYAQLIKNNEAIKKRRRDILGLDDAQKKASISADRFRTATLAMGGAFGAYSFGHLAAEAIRMADSYTAIQNRLAVVTDGTVNLTQATRDLLDVSIRSRTDLDSTMDVYAKLIRVTKNMSVSNDDLLRITESVSKAVAMSGASAQGAQGALLQFSQALSGDFQAAAQELNSIIEQTPAVAQLMADALNKADSSMNASIGNLKKLASEGRISTEVLLKGILLMSDTIDKQYANSTRTFSQGVVALRDSVTVAFGEIDKAFGGTGGLAEIFTKAAEGLKDYQAELAGVTAAVVGFVGTVGALGIGALLVSLGSIVATIGVVAVAVGGIIGAVAKYNVELALAEQATKDEEKALKDLDKQIKAVRDSFNELSVAAKQATYEREYNKLLEQQIKAQELSEQIANETVYTPAGDFIRITSLGQELQETLEKVNGQIAKQSELVIDLKGATEGIWDELSEDAQIADNLEKGNKALDEMLDKLDPVRAAWKEYYDEVSKVVSAGGSQEKQAEVLIALWDKLQETINKSKDAVGELSEEFKSFRSGLDPAYSSQLQYNNSMETLNKHLEKGSSLWLKLANTIKNDYNEALNAQLNERVTAGANANTGAVNMDYITRANEPKPEYKSAASFEKMARDFLDKMDKGVLGPQGASEMLVGLRTYADKLGALGEGFDVTGMRGTVEQLTAMARDTFAKPDYKDLTADELKRVFEEAQAKALEKEQAEIDAWKAEVESANYLKKLAENQGLVETDTSKAGKDAPKSTVSKFLSEENNGDIEYYSLSSIDRLVIDFTRFMDQYIANTLLAVEDNESLTAIKTWTEKQSEDKPKIGTINITVKSDKGGTVSGEVSGETDFLRKLASTLSGVSSAV